MKARPDVIFLDFDDEATGADRPLRPASPAASVMAPTSADAASDTAVDARLAQLLAENAQLKRDAQRQAREIEHLRAAASVTLNELDTQKLADGIARQAALILNADRSIIALTENDVTSARASFSNGQLVRADWPARKNGEGLAGWVALRRQPYVCNDPRVDAFLQPTNPQWRNALCVPILNHQGHVLGIIELHNRRDGGIFTQDDVRVAQTLAMQAAVGFERARMFERMQEWAQSLETLLAFNAAINAHLNPSMLVRRLVENAARFLKADGGMAGLAVAAEDDAAMMVSDAYWHQGRWHDYKRRWSRDQGLPGFMLVSEFPYVTNAYADDRLADADLLKRFGVQQALCVPIKDSSERVLGFFKLHKSSQAQPFTWQDAAFLESLANTTAVAIHNAQLLKALELKNEQIQALSAQHLHSLEEVRRHISRELHDEAGQALVGIKLALQVLALKIHGSMPELSDELDHLREQVNVSTAQLKDMARQLRPPTLDELGLTVALRQLASEYEQRTGIATRVELQDFELRLPQLVETALYRIAQEALTNAAKHARPAHVWLSLSADARVIHLTVSDDGAGFDVRQSHAGLGLLGMKERAGLLGGRVQIESGHDGTAISVDIPVAPAMKGTLE